MPAPLRPISAEPKSCGTDHGVVHAETVTSSDGSTEYLHYQTPDPTESPRYAKLEARKERCRRKRRRSRKWRALQRRQTRMRRRAASERKHERRQRANRIAKTHDVVGIEWLQNANMRRSARGTNERPGRNVAAKRALNRKLAASCPGYQSREQAQACIRHGTRYWLVPAAGTSITCAECGHRDPKSRETQAAFRCRGCPREANADANAGDGIRLLAEAYTRVGVSRLAAVNARLDSDVLLSVQLGKYSRPVRR